MHNQQVHMAASACSRYVTLMWQTFDTLNLRPNSQVRLHPGHMKSLLQLKLSSESNTSRVHSV